MTGCGYERAGITKDEARMIMMKICSPVPGFTAMRIVSFGAGIYGACGRAFDGRFMITLHNRQIGLMGGEPAANTLVDMNAAQMKRNGEAWEAAVQKDPHETTGKARMEHLSTFYVASALTPPLGASDHGALRP